MDGRLPIPFTIRNASMKTFREDYPASSEKNIQPKTSGGPIKTDKFASKA